MRHSQTVFELMDEDASGTISAVEFDGLSFLFNFKRHVVRDIFNEFDISGDQVRNRHSSTHHLHVILNWFDGVDLVDRALEVYGTLFRACDNDSDKMSCYLKFDRTLF